MTLMNACLNVRLRLLSSIGCLLTILVALPGCSLPKPQSDPTRFFVLSTEAAQTAPQPKAPTVHLREVELSNYLRARPLIVRRGANEIEFREFALWGEPLEMGIARVLREELLARGAASAVTSTARRERGNHDLNLSMRVLACEGEANGNVVFRAVWELANADSKAATLAAGDYRAAGLRWDGKSEGSLAAQLSEAVAGLAGEIAAALAKK
jgi:uncharacterized protein